jgi:hypothetical protein
MMMRRNTKMTQTDYTTLHSKTSEIVGLCATSDDPDMWFPEAPQGVASQKKMMALGTSVARAINICNRCPRQDACLDEGMQSKNLPYGIWGGKLAGERILMADARGMDYMTQGRSMGSVIKASNSERIGKGRHPGSVVLNESEKVTVQDKRKAIGFLRIIKPWIKEWK